jgi:hypothetical protein
MRLPLAAFVLLASYAGLEGASPRKAIAGTYFAMPADKKMAGVNVGNSDAVMLDIFFTPKGGEMWTIVELHHQNPQDQFVSPNP